MEEGACNRSGKLNLTTLTNHRASVSFGEHLFRGCSHSVGEETGMPLLCDGLQSKHGCSLTQSEQHLTEGHVWEEYLQRT